MKERNRLRVRTVAAAVFTASLLSGCGGPVAGPVQVANDFRKALNSGDGSAACALLAPQTMEYVESTAESLCAEGVTTLNLQASERVLGVDIYGRNAQVRLEGTTLFLTDSGGTWLIIAAGCTPRGERPYDCAVKGS